MTTIPRLNAQSIVFIFIDLQEKLLQRIPHAAQLTSRNELLLRAANLLELPYLSTTQYRKGLGEIVEPLRTAVRSSPLDKTTFSCAADPFIIEEMERYGRRSVVISGVETHICVLQTCLDLLSRGFEVSVVVDAVGARSLIDHELGLKRMERAGVLLVSAEMLIYELIGRSDSDAFKKILPLIKG
jgi:nicotinamidase-related amidase